VSSHPTADRADLHALQAGETAALGRLIARWQQPLFAFAWRYVRNTADARDLTAEIFVRLYQQSGRLRPDTNLSAWLFTSLANLCRNHHRWSRRHPGLPPGAAGESPGATDAVGNLCDETPAPPAVLEHKEELAALDTALGGLPHELKTALLLHHFEGMSYREIGAITGCSERGVETRLYRARAALRSALGSLRREALLP
jgi:RNA polymerase sigma factor (sigma-70 family)